MVEYVLIDGAWYPLDVDERIKDIYEINTDGDIRNKEKVYVLKRNGDM